MARRSQCESMDVAFRTRLLSGDRGAHGHRLVLQPQNRNSDHRDYHCYLCSTQFSNRLRSVAHHHVTNRGDLLFLRWRDVLLLERIYQIQLDFIFDRVPRRLPSSLLAPHGISCASVFDVRDIVRWHERNTQNTTYKQRRLLLWSVSLRVPDYSSHGGDVSVAKGPGMDDACTVGGSNRCIRCSIMAFNRKTHAWTSKETTDLAHWRASPKNDSFAN